MVSFTPEYVLLIISFEKVYREGNISHDSVESVRAEFFALGLWLRWMPLLLWFGLRSVETFHQEKKFSVNNYVKIFKSWIDAEFCCMIFMLLRWQFESSLLICLYDDCHFYNLKAILCSQDKTNMEVVHSEIQMYL